MIEFVRIATSTIGNGVRDLHPDRGGVILGIYDVNHPLGGLRQDFLVKCDLHLRAPSVIPSGLTPPDREFLTSSNDDSLRMRL